MVTRRDFVLLCACWFPFFWRRCSIRMAGISFRVIRRGNGTRRYLHIHGNEATARELLLSHMQTVKGTGFVIQSEQRYVVVRRGWIDPNRMFSTAGAEKSLRALNPHWSGEDLRAALRELDRDREKFLRAIAPPRGGLLIALHNNSETYSVQDETPISDRVSLKAPASPREFLLATHPRDFEILSASPFNVVLQNTPAGEDDGSLSRWAASEGVRYVNIEAALGNRQGQAEMLEWLEKNLPPVYGPAAVSFLRQIKPGPAPRRVPGTHA